MGADMDALKSSAEQGKGSYGQDMDRHNSRRKETAPSPHPAVFRPLQRRFLTIPQSPLCYWLRERFLELLAGRTLGDVADVAQGLATADDPQFVRYQWEVPVSEWAKPVRQRRWVPFEKGGGYGKWFGHQWWVVDWENDGERIKASPSPRVQNEQYYFKEGWTYSYMARGSYGLRKLNGHSIFAHISSAVIPRNHIQGLASCMNVRLSSYLVRALAARIQLTESYVWRLPALNPIPHALVAAEGALLELKRFLVVLDPTERAFSATTTLHNEVDHFLSHAVPVLLHALEGYSEHLVFDAYGLDDEDTAAVLAETGTPAGWYPLIAGYDDLPELPEDLAAKVELPDEFTEYLAEHERISPSPAELARIKDRLRALYSAGPGAEVNDENNEWNPASEKEEAAVGAYIPIPAETFLEELSQKMELHPISVYWLLEEMRREEGLVCPPELKRHAEDYFSVKLLRMLGHRWPMQEQYEEEQGKPFIDSNLVDRDGIIPLTPGTGEETLIERLRPLLDEEFGPERGPEVEREARMILGWKPGVDWGKQRPMPLERWFEKQFFKRHVSQFKRRPIAWHLTSEQGTFQAIVYYHKLDKNRLQLLRSRYVRQALESLRRQLGEAKATGSGRQALAKVAELEEKIADVEEFNRRLQRLLEGRGREARIWCPWKAPEEQPVGWDPDINDGVRVNIAPVQRLGLLAAPVLSKKDLNSLLAPKGRD